MGFTLLVMGLVFTVLGVYFFLTSLMFVKRSHIIEGIITKKELYEAEERTTIEFQFNNQKVVYHYNGFNSWKLGKKIKLRVIQKGEHIRYKINNFSLIFADTIILLPIGIAFLLAWLLL